MENPDVIWANAALAFLARCDIKGGEVDAFMRVRQGLIAIAQGRIALVQQEPTDVKADPVD